MGLTVHIYTLAHPITGEIRYVGKTCRYEKRKTEHLYEGNRTRKSNWIKSLRNLGLKPVMEPLEIIENSNDEDWQDVERFWIDNLRFLGCNLTNLDSGGRRGKCQSEETRRKIGNAHKGRVRSLESRRKQGLARRGVARSAIANINHAAAMRNSVKAKEHLARMCAGNRNRITPDHVKAKISEANKGKVRTLEMRMHLSAMKTGVKRSAESIRKQSLSLLGRKHSAEHVAKRAAFHKGRKRSPETCARIAEAARRTATRKALLRQLESGST